MLEYILAFIVMIVVFTGMMLALTFSKYKKRSSGCCGCVHCGTGKHSKESDAGCYNEKLLFVENYPEKT